MTEKGQKATEKCINKEAKGAVAAAGQVSTFKGVRFELEPPSKVFREALVPNPQRHCVPNHPERRLQELSELARAMTPSSS